MSAEDLLRLGLAVLAGGAIGLNRELYDKPAGLRTNILICVGAALFTLVSIRAAPHDADPLRVAAQIVTGVGFLGAGAIIQRAGNVHGMTTAATIWLVASIGMALGAGEYALGLVVTALILGVLSGLPAVERRIDRWQRNRHPDRFRTEDPTDADSTGA